MKLLIGDPSGYLLMCRIWGRGNARKNLKKPENSKWQKLENSGKSRKTFSQIFPDFPGFSRIFQDRVKIWLKIWETLPNNWEKCWYLKNTMASTPGAKSCLNEGPILHNSTVVLPMPVHVTPRELFKVLLDAFKVGLIKAFKAILKAFFKLFQRSKAFKF